MPVCLHYAYLSNWFDCCCCLVFKLDVSKINKRFKSNYCDNNNDPNFIANICFEAYKKLSKSGKPNPSKKEFTVLAGLVEYDKQGINSPKVVCLSTGTKCFPRNIDYWTEDIVDCHAESLLKRAFKCYLIEIINNWLSESNHSSSFEDFCRTALFNRTYCLFISQAPCGCFSRWKGDDPAEAALSKFQNVGINRKPGRGDPCPKPGCIHKIAKWRIFGLQGQRLLPIIGAPVIFDRIVIGNCEPEQCDDFDLESVADRITVDQKECSDFLENQPSTPFKFQQSTQIQFANKFRIQDFCRNDIPCGSSIVAWQFSSNAHQSTTIKCEILANGRKLGASKRKTCSDSNNKDHGLSKVNDLHLNQQIQMLIEKINKRSSGNVESKNTNENNLEGLYKTWWLKAKQRLSIFNGWPSIDGNEIIGTKNTNHHQNNIIDSQFLIE